MDILKYQQELEKKRIAELSKQYKLNGKPPRKKPKPKNKKPRKILCKMYLYPDDYAFLKWKSNSLDLSVGELLTTYISAKRRTERRKEKDRDKERSNSLEFLLKEIS